MPNPTFGQLKKLSPRDYWPSEAADFTPWLAEDANIALLGDAIGLELAVDGVEVTVGSFSADIICRSLPDEHRVVIENQLERTDHDHLGKLLTYAGGLDEVHTTILLAPEIRDEHRAAIDWLNAVTIDDVHFFGVELQVWCIADSLPAPRFVVVARPNDWRHCPCRHRFTPHPHQAVAARLLGGFPRTPPGERQCLRLANSPAPELDQLLARACGRAPRGYRQHLRRRAPHLGKRPEPCRAVHHFQRASRYEATPGQGSH